MRKTTARYCMSMLLSVLALPSGAAGAEPIIMAFRDKPPYSYVSNGQAKGFLLERTRTLLEHANLPYRFVEMPPKRIFMEIEQGKQAICSFGWYKTPEREGFAKFTRSIHQDRPHLILVGKHAEEKVRRHTRLQSLLSDAELRLAVVDGVSYGPEIDLMIGKFPGTVEKSLQSPVQVARKTALDRADFMFIDHEDYDYLMQTDQEFRKDNLKRINFPDAPAGLQRYILCSRSVPDSAINSINAAIAAIPNER